MSKRGRKPARGERYACGQLKPNINTPSAAHIRRAQGEALTRGRDPWLGTRLGWLYLNREITSTQVEAGLRFADLFLSYSRIAGFPPRSAPAIDLNRTPGRGIAEEDAAAVEALKSRYNEMTSGLYRDGSLEIVVAVCVDEQVIDWKDKKVLDRGLSTLVDLFGIK